MPNKQDFVNTRLLVHKHVKISVDEWILETTHPHKHVTFFGIFSAAFQPFLFTFESCVIFQCAVVFIKYILEFSDYVV